MQDFQTRQDYILALKEILIPLKVKYHSQQNGRIHLGNTGTTYTQKTSEVEAFLRPLWGLAPLLSQQEDEELEEIYYGYLRGLIKGVDPQSRDYWGHPQEDRQLIVEMAAIATAIILSKEKFWDVLSPQEQKQLHNWLLLADTCEIPHNNWHFFRILIHIAMRKCHQTFSQDQIDADFLAIESFYDAQGWYFDGRKEKRDYYIAFAFHYYSLLYYKEMQAVDTHRCAKIKQRACQFAQTFQYYFDDKGRGLPFGRSLTYRFAQVAFFSALVYANIQALPWKKIKQILSTHFTFWWQEKIFTDHHYLSVGYGYDNLVMAESYNGPGSPYWALKSFLILAVPKNHPFWQVSMSEKVHENPLFQPYVVKPARMMLQQTDNGQQLLGYPAAQWSLSQSQGISKYAKFVYSTQFGFSVAKSAIGYAEGGFDSTLAVSLDNRHFVTKEEVSEFHLLEDRIIQVWQPLTGVWIKSTIIPLGAYHLRIHQVQTNFPLYLYDGGFSIQQESYFKETHEANKVSYQSQMGHICCENIQGYQQAFLIANAPNTNVLHPRTVMCGLKNKLAAGKHCLIGLFGGSIKQLEHLEIKFSEQSLSIRTLGKENIIKI